MSVWECVETAKDFREISAKASSAWFALEIYLGGKTNGRLESLRKTIINGMDVCKLLEQAVEVLLSPRINPDNLGSFYRFKPVKEELKAKFGDINTIREEAKKTKEVLEKILRALEESKPSEFSKETIQERQEFFSKISMPYLKIADSWLKRACI